MGNLMFLTSLSHFDTFFKQDTPQLFQNANRIPDSVVVEHLYYSTIQKRSKSFTRKIASERQTLLKF